MENSAPIANGICTTYSRRDAAPILGVTNPTVGNRINSLEQQYPGLISGTMINDRLTDETIELLRLWANDRDAFNIRAAETPVTRPAVTVETHPPEQTRNTAALLFQTQQLTSNALTRREHTASLGAIDIPTIEIENIDVSIDDLRALIGLTTAQDHEASAYEDEANAYNSELTALAAIEDELDIAAIVADEKAKIKREKAIRAKVRIAETGKQIKKRAALAGGQT